MIHLDFAELESEQAKMNQVPDFDLLAALDKAMRDAVETAKAQGCTAAYPKRLVWERLQAESLRREDQQRIRRHVQLADEPQVASRSH